MRSKGTFCALSHSTAISVKASCRYLYHWSARAEALQRVLEIAEGALAVNCIQYLIALFAQAHLLCRSSPGFRLRSQDQHRDENNHQLFDEADYG
jgi:hypothetical protein